VDLRGLGAESRQQRLPGGAGCPEPEGS
jgi:hypothetical protein